MEIPSSKEVRKDFVDTRQWTIGSWSFTAHLLPLFHALLPCMHRTSLILAAWLLEEAAQVSPSGDLPGNVMETRSESDIEKHGYWQTSEEINYSIKVLIWWILYFKVCFSHNNILCFLLFRLSKRELDLFPFVSCRVLLYDIDSNSKIDQLVRHIRKKFFLENINCNLV